MAEDYRVPLADAAAGNEVTAFLWGDEDEDDGEDQDQAEATANAEAEAETPAEPGAVT